jgi:hypothetical protein
MEYQIGYKVGYGREFKPSGSAFMAIRALLGVKIFRRDAEHVVTLNANTVKHRFPRRRSFMFRGVRSGLSRFICHKINFTTMAVIATPLQERVRAVYCIPSGCRRILLGAAGVVQIRRRPVVCRLNLC